MNDIHTGCEAAGFGSHQKNKKNTVLFLTFLRFSYFCHITLGLLVFLQAEYSNCVNKLEKDLVSNYQSQFEKLFKAEAPTWETHGNLMVII